MLEWQRDWAQKGTYDESWIVRTHLGAYVLVESAYTMVHGLPATSLPNM